MDEKLYLTIESRLAIAEKRIAELEHRTEIWEKEELDLWGINNLLSDLVRGFPAGHTSNALQAAQRHLARTE